MPNPYALVVGLLLAVGALFGAMRYGEQRGVAIQAHADQVRIDTIARQLEEQTAAANKLRHDLDVAALERARLNAALTQQQELAHAQDQALTEERRRALARSDSGRLRVAVTLPDSACGGGGGGSVPPGADAARAPRSAVVELPGEVRADLLDLVHDADVLADAYRQCFRFAYPSGFRPLGVPGPVNLGPIQGEDTGPARAQNPAAAPRSAAQPETTP